MTQDIRWQQRLNNFEQALLQLTAAVELSQQRSLSELESQGLIQAFEFTFELGWNVLKDFLIASAVKDIFGPRDAIREAFSAGLIDNGEGWMQMLIDRNRTPHTYRQANALEIVNNILIQHFVLLQALQQTMQARIDPHDR